MVDDRHVDAGCCEGRSGFSAPGVDHNHLNGKALDEDGSHSGHHLRLVPIAHHDAGDLGNVLQTPKV